MNGTKINKKYKSADDLFPLSTDIKTVKKALKGDAANDFMKTIVKQ